MNAKRENSETGPVPVCGCKAAPKSYEIKNGGMMRKREVDTVQVMFKIERSIRDEFKISAAKSKKTMTQALEEIMREFTKKSETPSK